MNPLNSSENKVLIDFKDYQTVIEALADAPFAIRLVGGTVRDTLWSLTAHELDFAAQCTYRSLRKFCAQAPLKIINESPQHGSLKVLILKHIIDITILRKDQKTDGRHAEIRHTNDWLTDALRRDFTFNALYVDTEGRLFDPLAQAGQSGIKDLKNHHLRFIGQAEKRIQEDYLRILRYFRFQAQHDCSVDSTDLKAINKHKSGLKKLSKERIGQEWRKLIIGKNASKALKKMQSIDLFQTFLPTQPHDFMNLEKVQKKCRNVNYPLDPMLNTAIIFRPENPDSNTINSLSKELQRAFVLSNAETKQLKRLWQPTNDHPAITLLHYFGINTALQILLMRDSYNTDDWQTVLQSKIPKMPISGHDLKPLGLKNQAIAHALSRIEQFWLKNNAQPNQKELMDWWQHNREE